MFGFIILDLKIYYELDRDSGEALLKSFEGMGSGEGELLEKVPLPQPPEATL